MCRTAGSVTLVRRIHGPLAMNDCVAWRLLSSIFPLPTHGKIYVNLPIVPLCSAEQFPLSGPSAGLSEYSTIRLPHSLTTQRNSRTSLSDGNVNSMDTYHP